jgi:hypothetical protein
MGHESQIEPCVATCDNRSACEFQIGLASSRRAMKTAWEEKTEVRLSADGAVRQKHPGSITWGWKQEKVRPSAGEVFSLDIPVYRTSEAYSR